MKNFQPKEKTKEVEGGGEGGEGGEVKVEEMKDMMNGVVGEVEIEGAEAEEDVEEGEGGRRKKRKPRCTADLAHRRTKSISFMKTQDEKELEENGLPPALIEPVKPVFKAMMSDLGVIFLMDTCKQYMTVLRRHWDPNNPLQQLPEFKELGFSVAERLAQSEKDKKFIDEMGW